MHPAPFCNPHKKKIANSSVHSFFQLSCVPKFGFKLLCYALLALDLDLFRFLAVYSVDKMPQSGMKNDVHFQSPFVYVTYTKDSIKCESPERSKDEESPSPRPRSSSTPPKKEEKKEEKYLKRFPIFLPLCPLTR